MLTPIVKNHRLINFIGIGTQFQFKGTVSQQRIVFNCTLTETVDRENGSFVKRTQGRIDTSFKR